MISHERVARLLGQLGFPRAVARRAADRLNARLVAEFDVVVCATAFAQAEFDRIGAAVLRVPFGVDLDTFTPSCRNPRLRRGLAAGAGVLLVLCGRLSREKHPQRSIDATAALHAAGVNVRLANEGRRRQRPAGGGRSVPSGRGGCDRRWGAWTADINREGPQPAIICPARP
jgi:alpha-1,6-mannosyltransferase